MRWRQNPSLDTLLQWGTCRKEHYIYFVRRELEYQIQAQTSRYSFEIIIMLEELLNRQIVPFRKNLLWRLAKEHLPPTEGMKKQVDIYNIGKHVISNTWAEVSKAV